MADVVEIDRVGKTYREGPPALAEVTLTVRSGEVYGLVGRNGAGKSTVLGIVVGLVRASTGTVQIRGAGAGTTAALARTGVLLESCGLYPNLTGRQNLHLLARLRGVTAARVADVLAGTGMTAAADRRLRNCSHGMRRRLGIAAALLGEPELLVLDEPTDGLDPGGIVALRGLVRTHADAGGAVLLSSHLLGELEQVCDRVGLIEAGRLVADGDPAALGVTGPAVVVLRCDRPAVAVGVLQAHPAVHTVSLDQEGLRVVLGAGHDPEPTAAVLNRALVEAGVAVSALAVPTRRLESAFLALTGGPATGGPDPAGGDRPRPARSPR